MENVKDRIEILVSNVKKVLKKKEIGFLLDNYAFKCNQHGINYKHINETSYKPVLNNTYMILFCYENIVQINRLIKREL